ncbi:hypothetical protein PV724_47400 [Streptomyces europaeiscabiei]|uniref:hypothetical protein n=1 Tax=Streptomyces europaeiscabiei TaxID=146819 RepID=UPI0029B9F3E9|nr:hypothetical protein [Streptomyces europaeiscabiei]MDX3550091.1 hypothetical protein [Streptomyces europaeiscabiei]
MAAESTNVYRRRWQREAHRVLGELLAFDDLPAMAWTIAVSGAVTGAVDSLTSTPVEQRAAFTAWAARLGATPTERTDRAGVVHLYAPFAWGQAVTVGAIRATIHPEFDAEDGGL